MKGRRLAQVSLLEEYWFDSKAYQPATDVARHIF